MGGELWLGACALATGWPGNGQARVLIGYLQAAMHYLHYLRSSAWEAHSASAGTTSLVARRQPHTSTCSASLLSAPTTH